VPVRRKRLYVNKVGKKARTNRTAFWVITFLIVGAFIAGWWLWTCLYNVSPRFNFLSITKDEKPLKLFNGEILPLHPQNRIRILDVSTNVCFNRGVRLSASHFDVNALRYEEMRFATLLPDEDIFNRYTFRVEIKHGNRSIGHVDILVEPHVEDWLDKAHRTIDRERKVAILERALKAVPEDRRIRDRLVQEYRSLKRWNEVALMLEGIAKENPDEKVLYDLLEVYKAMSKTDGIINVLKSLVEKDPNNMDVRLRLASVLEKSGRLKEAIKEYGEVLKGVAKEDGLYLYKVLGYLYTQTGQTDKAIDSYLSAVELDKKDQNLYYNLFYLYEKTGQKDQANIYLDKAVSLKSGDVESRLTLSERLMEKGKLNEAEKHITEVLKKSPNSMKALLLMVNIMERKGDKEQLKRFYQKILQIEPQNKTVIYNLGVLEYETGDLEKALPYFQKFVESHPKDAEVHNFLFDIYRRQKKDQHAYKEASILLGLKPEEINYFRYVFEFLNKQVNYTKMIEIMKNGVKFHPKNIEMREYLILAYLKTGKEDLAIGEIHEILKIKPKDITLLLQLARLSEKQEKFKEALEAYKKIIDISPGHEEAEEAYLRLRLKVLPKE